MNKLCRLVIVWSTVNVDWSLHFKGNLSLVASSLSFRSDWLLKVSLFSFDPILIFINYFVNLYKLLFNIKFHQLHKLLFRSTPTLYILIFHPSCFPKINFFLFIDLNRSLVSKLCNSSLNIPWILLDLRGTTAQVLKVIRFKSTLSLAMSYSIRLLYS